MLSKFSVKKPFTILVIVILIIVFGVVAFSKSTMDLFPSIDLPYVMVMTTYPGAAPEQVEKNVSQPMEQQMASLENLKNITSMSYDNYSMIMLEFNNDTDLNTVSVDIRDKIDLVSGSFDDSVEKPVIFKMNPDIMPTVVAAVTDKGKDVSGTSTLVEEELQRKLEGTDGVASVSAAGMVENKVHITLDQDKIDKKNKELKKAAGSQVDDSVSSINKAADKASDGEKKVADGQSEIEKAQKSLAMKKEVISKALSALQTLTAGRESALQMDPGADTSVVDSQISAVVKQLRPYKKDLKKMGVDVNKASGSSTEAAKALSTFNIAMSISTDHLNNQMSSLAGTDAYLKSVLDQLKSSKAQAEAQKKTAEDSADISSMLTMDSISQIISSQNFEMPAGYVSDDGKDLMVTVGDKMTDMDQISDLVLLDTGISGVDPVKLKDVATISYMDNGEDTYAKINGKEGVLLTFTKQSDYSTTEAANNVLDKFTQLEKDYDGVKFTTLSDQGSYIKIVIDSVLQNLILGAILAILILLFFLRDIRPTLITACSIPISVTFAFVLMYFTGVTLNVISMAGLAVGVGMLVDNSIVVIENIYRLRSLGYSRKDAAIKGSTQVAGAITASTLTTVSVFIPIVFVEGITRQIFVDMALTIAYSLLASLFIALTLVPAMGRALFRRTNKNTVLSRASRFIGRYRVFVKSALAHKKLVLIIALVLFAGSVTAGMAKGFEYMPSMASEEISGSMYLPAETKQERCFEIYDEMSTKIEKMKGVDTVGIMLESEANSVMGVSAAGSDSDFTKATLYILLDEDQIGRNSAVSKEIKKAGEKYGAEMTVSGDMDITGSSSLGGGGISIDVESDDLDDLKESAAKIEDRLRGMKGLTDVSDSRENTVPDLRISVDKNKAAEKGFTTAQLYAAISSKLSSEKTATTIKVSGSDRDVVLKDADNNKITKDQLLNKTLSVTTAAGKTVKVKVADVASVSEDTALTVINRKNQKRTVNVTAAIDDGYNTTKMSDKVEKTVDKMDLPSSVGLGYGGENQAIMDAMKQLLLMMGLGLLLIYLIMVAQFQSLLSPFIVMFTVPLAFTGGILALLITGNCISVVSMIGFVMLMGIIVNNAIVLIDYINQLRLGGMDKKDAIIEAGATRLRPVLMTALTTVLGLLPLAMGIGSGSEMMQPVAIVCIGGLLYATLMTLVVIPVMYDILHRKKKKVISSEELTSDKA
ncbi:MAG: efflux RND transporter permease subunit [Eubacteriaceae bacterium]|nr:efflux RND transporter permease subunit [Eubacteriaceae bacterium]